MGVAIDVHRLCLLSVGIKDVHHHQAKIYFSSMYVSALPACVPMHQVHPWCQGSQKGVLDLSELELQKTVMYHFGAGN